MHLAHFISITFVRIRKIGLRGVKNSRVISLSSANDFFSLWWIIDMFFLISVHPLSGNKRLAFSHTLQLERATFFVVWDGNKETQPHSRKHTRLSSRVGYVRSVHSVWFLILFDDAFWAKCWAICSYFYFAKIFECFLCQSRSCKTLYFLRDGF